MTKKHFIALADHLRLAGQLPARIDAALISLIAQGALDARSEEDLKLAAERLRYEVALELADFCKAQNRDFDRARWLGYIRGENGPSGGTVKPKRGPK